MVAIIQVKRGTAAALTSANPVLTAGEIVFETDTKKMKVGDGTTAWTSLLYVGTEGDITAVVAGTGLSGGSTSGSATLSIDTATTVDKTTAQTLTNKTLTSPTVSGLTLSDASIIIEGASANDFETTLTVTDPTADRTITLPNATGTVMLTDALVTAGTVTTGTSGIGYMGIPLHGTTTGAHAVIATDAGTCLHSTATRTITLPANGTIALPVGTTITFTAFTGATVTIAITTDTMYLAGSGTTGSRTLAAYGMATALKLTTTTWLISGNGLT